MPSDWHADVTDLGRYPGAGESDDQKLKRIHILVNNAGVLLPGNAESLPEAAWEQTFNTNVRGVWMLSRAVLPHMRAAGGGSIINLGSVLSSLGARNRVAYAASKGAVLAMTKAMALDHAAERIRVNCICPRHCGNRDGGGIWHGRSGAQAENRDASCGTFWPAG